MFDGSVTLATDRRAIGPFYSPAKIQKVFLANKCNEIKARCGTYLKLQFVLQSSDSSFGRL